MKTIIHKIKLKNISHLQDFEEWVLTKDYIACADLASVREFDVSRVSDSPSADYHFVEVIKASSQKDFEADMATPVFSELVNRFDQMAEVVEEIDAHQLGGGYRQS